MSCTLISAADQGKFKATCEVKESSCIYLPTWHHNLFLFCTYTGHNTTQTSKTVVRAHVFPVLPTHFWEICTKYWVVSVILQGRRTVLDICKDNGCHGTWKCEHEIIWMLLCPFCLPIKEALTSDVVKFWKTTDLWVIFEISGSRMSYYSVGIVAAEIVP